MTNSSDLVAVCIVSIRGKKLPLADEVRLTSVQVERDASTCDRVELRFDMSRDDSSVASVGDAVRIAVDSAGSSNVVLLDAEVTSKAVEVHAGGTFLVIGGYDKRHLLTRSVNTRAFNDATFADVVKKIAGEHDLTIVDKTNGAMTSTVFPHIMQAGSDFEMVQQITYRIGAEWFADDEKLTIQLRPTSGSAIELSPDRNLVSFNVRYSPVERATEISVQGWDVAKTESIVGTATEPKTVNNFDVAKHDRNGLEANSAIEWAVPVISVKDAEGVAAAIGRRIAASSVIGHGETIGTPELVPGALCTISDVGDDFSGTYHVASVEHSFGEDGSYRTRFRIGPLEPSSLVDMFSTGDAAFGQVFNGVTIGIVSNIEHPDGRSGVAKLKLPYLGRQVESTWARLVSFGGGDRRGAAFVPEVGDEVLVAFEHGDIARPYILGSVWNEQQTPELFDGTIENGKVRERRITSKLGSKLRFIDAKQGDDESGLAIEVDDGKTKLFFGYKKTEIITNDRPLELKNGKASILLDGDEITITAKAITLKASGGDVEISGTNVKIDAQSKLSVSGAQVELDAKAQAKLQASGMMIVKGSMVKVN